MTELIRKLSQRYRYIIAILVLCLGFSAGANAQNLVKGKIVDAKNQPLPGATVVNISKKENNKASSDGNGEFSISGENGNTLEISIIGFTTQRVTVKGNDKITVTLQEGDNKLDEVVVVGYGTQKKINLSGSVSTVSGKVLNERPVPNVQNLLQGRVAGLDVVQPTGEPGRDAGSFRLRGLGSYGASPNPLVLIDGVIGDLSKISPQDIENVSVLKDAASASIYGSRAANGVILVTTKKGRAGTDNIEYNGSYGLSYATRYPKLINDAVTYMEMYNAAKARSGEPAVYTQAQIDLYRNNPNSDQYPSFSWLDYVFKMGPIQNHNLGFSGGTDKSTYNLSLNYLDQGGIVRKYNYDRYNALLDYSNRITSRIKIGTNVNFTYENVTAPWQTNQNLILLAYAAAPTFKPFLPDGRLANRDFATTSGNNRTIEEVNATGGQFTKNYNVNAQVYAEVDLLKGLKWTTKGAFTFFNQDYRNRQFRTNSYTYQPDNTGVNPVIGNGNSDFVGLRQSSDRNLTKTLYSTLNYNKTFNEVHNFSALLGYEQQDNRSTTIGGGRFDFPNSTINELDGSSPVNQVLNGSSFEWALQSVFARVNYDYKGKYFVEGNFRRDGTSRVDPKFRWGSFGGASAAWRISEENFIKDNVKWIDNLKLRTSYGVLGNQEIRDANGNFIYYPYQDILNPTSYPFSSLSPGLLLTRLTNKGLKWEKTAITDFGLDFDLFKGLLGGTIGYYRKNTTDILTQRQDSPASLGLDPPVVNAGAMVNKGIEIELRHQNKIGEFTYSISGIFSRYRNKVTKVLAENLGTFEVGQPFNNFFLYDWIGVFQSQQEIDASPKQPNSGTLRPGDLKIRDVDGNGTVGPEDRIRISSFPDYTYSFNLSAGYKGFTLSAFFQGVQGQKLRVDGWGYEPFRQGSPPPVKFLNAWTPTNPSNTVPAIYQIGYPGVAGYNSTYFLQDASYLRLKNLYLSYTLPNNIAKKVLSKGITVYVSGDNLITWTNYEGSDPERAGSDIFAQFPQLRVYTFGVRAKF